MNQKDQPVKLITPREFARRLNKSTRHVAERVMKQEGFPQPAMICGRVRLFDEQQIADFFKQRKFSMK